MSGKMNLTARLRFKAIRVRQQLCLKVLEAVLSYQEAIDMEMGH